MRVSKKKQEGAFSPRQVSQRVGTRQEKQWTEFYGGRKSLKIFLMRGPLALDDLSMHVDMRCPRSPPQDPPYRPRKLNIAHKARRMAKYYQRFASDDKKVDEKPKSTLVLERLNHIEELQKRARELTEEQQFKEQQQISVKNPRRVTKID